MSSSNRAVSPACDMAVYRDKQPVGPLRLPRTESASFVAEFNRLYGPRGMVLRSIGTADSTTAPPSTAPQD